MPRIPYVVDSAADASALVAEIRARRGGKLLNLDRMLLHSPALAQAWNAYLGAIRGNLSVAPKLRELAILSVAVLNGADYEFAQHLPLFLRAGGTPEAAKALRSFDAACDDPVLFSAAERATMKLTAEMTRQVALNDSTFESVRRELLDDQHVVELVAIIATYNMVSRFLVALAVEGD